MEKAKRTIITVSISFVLAAVVTFCLAMARQDALEATAPVNTGFSDCDGYGYSYSHTVGDGTYGYSYGYSSNVALSKEEIIAKIEAAQTRTLRSKEEIIAKIEAAQTRALHNDIAGVPAYADPTDLTEEEKQMIEEAVSIKRLERPREKEIPAYADPTDLTEEEKQMIGEAVATKCLERPREKEIPEYYNCLSNNIAGVPAYAELSAEYKCNLPTYAEGPVCGTTEEGFCYMIW